VLLVPQLLDIVLDESHPLHFGKSLGLGQNPDEHDSSGVWAFLKDKLIYRVVNVDGEVIPNDHTQLEDLKLSVMVGKVDHHPNDDSALSTFKDFSTLFTLHQTGYNKVGDAHGNPWGTPLVGDRPAGFYE
jgi:hypothetical protein